MQYNCTFTTYRRETSGATRRYSSSATITNGSGYYEPLSGDLRGVLGLDSAVQAYQLITEESDLQIGDKVVISTSNYYIEELEQIDVNSIVLSRAIIKVKA